MKILLVHPENPSEELTWSRTPYFLIKAFNNKSITIIPFATGPINKINRFFFKTIQLITRLDYHYSISFRLFSAKKLKFAIQKYRPDVVLHMGTSSAITYLNSDIPNYLYADNTWHLSTKYCLEFMNPQPSIGRINKIDKFQEHDFNKFTGIFAISNFAKTDIINHYKISENRVHYAGGGIGNVNPNFGEKDYSKKQLLFIARHSFKSKGGELMLAAARILQKKMPELKIIISGGVKITSNYADIKNLEIKGVISRNELQTLFETSTLLVMPSLFEPFGLVYLEAMINKTPIIGLNRGALPDITVGGKYGFIAEEPSPEAISDQIFKALSNVQALEIIAIEGQNYILENFTWEKVVDKFLKVILADKKEKNDSPK